VFAATGTYSDGLTKDLTADVTWASSSPTVATISNVAGSKGVATGLVQGQTTIGATLAGVSGTTTLTVTDAVVASITIAPANATIARGTVQPYVATALYSDGSSQVVTAQVTWVSANTGVAIISNATGTKGLATAVGSGTATISAALGGVTGMATLTVTSAALLSISVTPANTTLSKGTTAPYTATGLYADGSSQDITTQATWASTATAVATVSNAAGSKGLVSAVGEGTTTVSASLSGITGSTGLTVTGATLVSIAVTPPNAVLKRSTMVQFKAVGMFSDNTMQDITTQVTWASSNTNVATVSNAVGSAGLATAVAAGTTTVSATIAGVTGTAQLRVM
jgi:hypothetical protein